MARLTWHGHSCWTLETEGARILFDPFLDDNPKSEVKAAEIGEVDYILVSHGHFDHFADCIPIAKRTGATVVSTFELVAFCQTQGVENGHGMNIGGAHRFPFGRVKLTPAVHTGSIAGDDEGAFTTDCCGFLLDLAGDAAGVHTGSIAGDDEGAFTTDCCGFLLDLAGGKRLYHAGDTALIVDMQLLAGQVDVALLPIGDNFTMGPEDAARAVEFIRPATVIPMHYDTWELIAQDPEEFRRLVGDRAAVEVVRPGGSYEF